MRMLYVPMLFIFFRVYQHNNSTVAILYHDDVTGFGFDLWISSGFRSQEECNHEHMA